MIAHIERYSAFIKNPSLPRILKDSGVLLQVNARAITKFKFGKTAKFLKNAFKKNLIDIVASDAHDCKSISPNLSRAYNAVAKKYGSDYANKIFHHTPLSILMNEKEI